MPLKIFQMTNREYYTLRFSEVQKELAGIKAEVGMPRKIPLFTRDSPR